MQTQTLLLIILSAISALFLAGLQYCKTKKGMSKLNMLFLVLRFITIFSVLLLLINPKFEQTRLTAEKPNLVIATDNSNSVTFLNQDKNTKALVSKLLKNNDLQKKFTIQSYTFGRSLKLSDSLLFDETETNIYEAFNQLNQVYKQSQAPTILITDGNQTFGSNYEFVTNTYKQPIFPVILGDTITYSDLKIQQLNVNKYAFLKNNFPIETVLVYNGNATVTSRFTVTSGNTTVYSQTIEFTKNANSKIINFTLPANNVGVQILKATLEPLANEKNTINNYKNFAIEVIDQKTKVAIVSDMLHPDLGALKKSIETNEQRSVAFVNSKDIINQINDFQLLILYQPNNSFKNVIEVLNAENKNRFIIVGTKTDLNFLNKISQNYQFETTNQTETYQAELNQDYSPFLINSVDFESFPPLKSNYGNANFSVPFETILGKTINGISLKQPLLATLETNGRREAVLLGENIWQWRSQNFLNTTSFAEFDDFIGKLIQYLASNKQKSRLDVDYQSFYNGNNHVVIKAEFFDKNYVFSTRGHLQIQVTNKATNITKTLPLILKNNNYQVDLGALTPSDYNFKVTETNENISKSGSFTILEYNVEQQFLNANVTKLQQLATNSQGKSFFIDEDVEHLVNQLLNDNRFVTIQKSNKNSLPLIDWKYILIIIALSLSMEWFLRKYNGLI